MPEEAIEITDAQPGPGAGPESERTERNQGRGSSRRGRRGGRHRPSGQRRGSDKPQERMTDASPAVTSQGSGETQNTGAQRPSPATVASPSGEQTRSTAEPAGKPAAEAGSSSPQSLRDDGTTAYTKTDYAVAAPVSAMTGQERKSAGETSTPTHPVDKVEVKVDKASS
jgi:hypothetical protein